MPHCHEIPVPNPPAELQSSSEYEIIASEAEYCQEEISNGSPKLFSQAELNDLTRELNLSIETVQILKSRLKEKNLLEKGTTFVWYRHREKEFTQFFHKEDTLVYCTGVQGLIEAFAMSHQAEDFMDSSKTSMKAVLLYNELSVLSIPVALSTEISETYENLEILLKLIKYNEHNWLICADLKVVPLILELQGGYTKFPCFLCILNSRADASHFT